MNKKQIEDKISKIYGCNSSNDKKMLLRKYAKSLGYTEDVTGDACKGDVVIFARATFYGSYRKPRYGGDQIVTGVIVSDSYGNSKQQHTFTIKTRSSGKMMIKGRNLYSIGVFAKKRENDERNFHLNNKHQRGNIARQQRQYRLNNNN